MLSSYVLVLRWPTGFFLWDSSSYCRWLPGIVHCERLGGFVEVPRCCVVTKLCLTLAALWTVAHQVPLSMRFPRQEYWSRLPFPPPGDLPNPGIEPASLKSPALAARFFTTSTTWKHVCSFCHFNCFGFVFVRSFFLPFLFFVLLRFDELYCCVWTPFLCVYCRFSVCDYNEVLI